MKKLYPDLDINDIIEDEENAFIKGGPGSGRRGHVTNQTIANRMAESRTGIDAYAKLDGMLNKLYGSRKTYSKEELEAAIVKTFGDKRLGQQMYSIVTGNTRIQKGGPGSGRRGHTTDKPSRQQILDYLVFLERKQDKSQSGVEQAKIERQMKELRQELRQMKKS